MTKSNQMDDLKESLKVALENNDFEMVSSISSEIKQLLEAKKQPKKRGRPKKIKLEKPAQKKKTKLPNGLVEEDPEKFPVLGPKKKEKPKRENYFVDNLKFCLTDEDTGESLLQDKKPPPRKASDRPEYQPIQVHCAKCGKKERVNPILARKRVGDEEVDYLCNKCVKIRR